MTGPMPRVGGRPSRREWVVIVVALVAVLGVAAIALASITFFSGTGPAYLWMVEEAPVLAGSPGCLPRSGEVCYEFQAGVETSGFRLADVRFECTNESGGTPAGPSAPARLLGPGASVLVLNATGTPVGAWNWSARAWVYGSSWALPAAGSFSVIFDTGYTNASAVVGAMLTMTTTSPIEGSVGSPLALPSP